MNAKSGFALQRSPLEAHRYEPAHPVGEGFDLFARQRASALHQKVRGRDGQPVVEGRDEHASDETLAREAVQNDYDSGARDHRLQRGEGRIGCEPFGRCL